MKYVKITRTIKTVEIIEDPDKAYEGDTEEEIRNFEKNMRTVGEVIDEADTIHIETEVEFYDA